MPDEIKSETLKRLGEIHIADLSPFIKYLLIWGLNSNSSIIKFGAITGIASFGDKNLIHDLEKKYAIERDGITRKLIFSAINFIKKI